MFGPIEGIGEPMIELLAHLRRSGYDPRDGKKEIIEELIHNSEYYYYPPAYQFHMNKEFPLRIESVERLDDKAPNKIKFSRPYDVEDMSFAKKVFYKNGANSDSCDTYISEGCSGGNCCSFKVAEGTWVVSEDGPKRIEEIVGESVEVEAFRGMEVCKKIVSTINGRINNIYL